MLFVDIGKHEATVGFKQLSFGGCFLPSFLCDGGINSARDRSGSKHDSIAIVVLTPFIPI